MELKLKNKELLQGVIPAIKAIREVSTCGLKDAKDVTDALCACGEYTVTTWRVLNTAHKQELKKHGISVHMRSIPLRERTRQLLFAAIKGNDRVLAKGLFQAWYESTND